MPDVVNIIEKLKNGEVSDSELEFLLRYNGSERELAGAADGVRREVYGDKVYIRGLIEFTNYCKNDCFYCGIRKSNGKVRRYRLDKNQILERCRLGYGLGFRTFVLQGGEDEFFSDGVLCGIVGEIREEFPDCAITLSMGERSRESFKKLYEAGANRYLLRHEAVTQSLYSKLHPKEMSLENRLKCLDELREIGYQTGTGFMVGAPNQTIRDIIEDIRFIEGFRPQMIGIGPYIPHPDTPYRNAEGGDVLLTLKLISIFRLMLPPSLIPSTTALATAGEGFRAEGLKAGANVVMPNLSPDFAKENYTLYQGKAAFGAESADGLKKLGEEVKAAGYEIVNERGDAKETYG